MRPKPKIQHKPNNTIGDNSQTLPENSNKLLQAILNAQRHFQDQENPQIRFEFLLQNLLELSESESAFIAEVSDFDDTSRQIEAYIKHKNEPPEKTQPPAKLIWNETPQNSSIETSPVPPEIQTLKTLLKANLNPNQPIVYNQKNKQIPFDKFLGVPVYKNQKLIAMIGVANRKGGYNQTTINYLEGFILTCKNLIIVAYTKKQLSWAEQEIKKNQQQLRPTETSEENNELFKATFNLAPLGIIQITPEGKWLQVNQKYCDILGYKRQEIMSMNRDDITHPDDLPAQKELIKKLLSGEIQTYSIEKRYLHKSGSIVWVKVTFSLARYPSGEPKYYIGIVEDITQRKQLKAELAKQKQLFDSFFKISPVGMCIFNEQLQVVQINDALAAMSGPTVEEHLGKTIWEIAPELAPNVDPIYRQVLNSGKQLLNIEVAGATKREPGVWRHWLTSYFPLYKDEQQKPIGLGSVVIEITDRKRAEQELQKLASVIANSPDFIGVATLEGKAEFINEAGLKMVGLENIEKAKSKNVLDYLWPEDIEFFKKQIIPTVMQNGSWQGEFRFRHFKTGLSIPIDCNIFLIKDSQTGHPIAICTTSRNISERKQAQQALLKSQQRLQLALQGSDSGLWDMNLISAQTYYSPEYSQIFGYQPGEIDGTLKGWQNTIHPQDLPSFDQKLNEHFAHPNIPFTTEYRSFSKNGEIKWIAARGKIVEWDTNGNPTRMTGTVTDITDRKVAEITLREREQFLASIYDGVEFAIFAVDLTEKGEFRYVGWNPMCERIMGLNSSIVIGQTIHKVLPKEIADQFCGYYRQCIQAGISLSFEQEFLFHGQQTWWISTLTPLRDIHGKIYRIIGTTTEITERVRAEENLRQQKQTLRAITDNAPIWIWMTNTSQKIQFINKTFCENTGIPESQWLAASSYAEILPPEVSVKCQASDIACLNQDLPYQTDEIIVFSDGQPHELETIKAKVKNGDGQVMGIVGLAVDVTQEKQAQRQLKESETRFRKLAQQEALFNQIANQIRNSLDINTILETTVHEVRSLLQVDRCLFVWYFTEPQPTWNVAHESKTPELFSLIGYYPANPNSQSVQNLLSSSIFKYDNIEDIPDLQEREFFKSLGYKSMLDLPIQPNQGCAMLACMSCAEVRTWQDEEVELMLAISVQISIAISQADLYQSAQNSAQIAQEKARQLEIALSKLQQTQTQLIQTEKMSSLGQMVAGIAHEINNPTNFIYGNIDHANEYIKNLLELLQLYQKHYPNPVSEIAQKAEETDIDFLAEDLPKILASMKMGATRIRDIVKSLRTFSRLDEADMKEVDIHEGIESTLLILEHRLKKTGSSSGISIFKNYGQLPLVQCYAGQLNQVFMNILTNAIDALEIGINDLKPQEQNPAIIITTSLKKGQILINIKDNGPGMTEEVKHRLFDPFFTTKPVGAGTGLGMSISYQIIEKHNGQLQCISSPGKGAEFCITLPVKNPRSLH